MRMRIRTIEMLAAAAAPLLACGSADAAYVAVEGTVTPVTITDSHFNHTGEAWVMRLWVAVSSPLDIVPAVYGNAGNPLSLSVSHPDGFFQHEFGGLAEPGLALVGAFPELAYDSFVTIGQLAHTGGAPTPQTSVQGDLAFGAATLTASDGAWFRTPDSPQVHAIPAPTSTGLGVLIGQFTMRQQVGLDYQMNIVVNTSTFTGQVGFVKPAPGALPLLALAALRAGRGRRRREERAL